jgi:hypothetical protein
MIETTWLRVRNAPCTKVNKGPSAWERVERKCTKAESGQKGDGSENRWMCTPRPNWSVLQNGRRSVA